MDSICGHDILYAGAYAAVIPESICAPIEKNSAIGQITYYLNGEKIGSIKLHVVVPDTIYFTSDYINIIT